MIGHVVGQPAEPQARPLSEVLSELPADRAVTLGDTLGAMGTRAHGCALLVLALPDALPVPIPSLSLVLALPLVLITLHLAAYGAGRALPDRVGGVALPMKLVAALRDWVAPLLRRAEGLSHPRWQSLAGQERLLALVCLYLGILLLLPIPLFNTPPALCLVLVAWGMVQRDGAIVMAGLAGTAAVTVALVWLAERLGALAASATALAL
jgi:hypothetical protein